MNFLGYREGYLIDADYPQGKDRRNAWKALNASGMKLQRSHTDKQKADAVAAEATKLSGFNFVVSPGMF